MLGGFIGSCMAHHIMRLLEQMRPISSSYNSCTLNVTVCHFSSLKIIEHFIHSVKHLSLSYIAAYSSLQKFEESSSSPYV